MTINIQTLAQVLDLIKKGTPVKTIAKKTGCSRTYVYDVRKKYMNASEQDKEFTLGSAPVKKERSKVYTIHTKPQKPQTKPVRETLDERGSKYGPFHDQAGISQALKDVVYATLWQREKRLAPDQMEALDMILHKVARIVNGDADYADSWHDIAGYAQLVETRLVTGEKI